MAIAACNDCSAGAVRDPSFGEFAAYIARVLAYYNVGSFVAEDGRTIINPAGTANRIGYWELWNEPDQRTLGCPPSASHISASEYGTMWNATVPTMLAVLVGILINNSRLSDLRSYLESRFADVDRRFDDMKETWRSELHRVEEVLDARLKHLEER